VQHIFPVNILLKRRNIELSEILLGLLCGGFDRWEEYKPVFGDKEHAGFIDENVVATICHNLGRTVPKALKTRDRREMLGQMSGSYSRQHWCLSRPSKRDAYIGKTRHLKCREKYAKIVHIKGTLTCLSAYMIQQSLCLPQPKRTGWYGS
jgi:hypothetical protein